MVEMQCPTFIEMRQGSHLQPALAPHEDATARAALICRLIAHLPDHSTKARPARCAGTPPARSRPSARDTAHSWAVLMLQDCTQPLN